MTKPQHYKEIDGYRVEKLFFFAQLPQVGSRLRPMRKNYLTVILLASALSTLTLQSFGLVPPPESLKATKHNEQAHPVDPNTTVIVSGKLGMFMPTHPSQTNLAMFMPTHPSQAKPAMFMPTHPSQAKLAMFMPTHPSQAKPATFMPTQLNKG